MAPTTQSSLSNIERIKQYPGQIQVDRSVKVNVPGKHFPMLTGTEQRTSYEGVACEFTERHRFPAHARAWGAAHVGPGIRFVCESDAIDDANHNGFWTTLSLWNRWRHDTYKDNRDAELQFLDELPAAPNESEAAAGNDKEKNLPEVKLYFDITNHGIHTYGGSGRLSGKKVPCAWYACKKAGCKRGPLKPIKQVGSCTGQLFDHLEMCQPQLCKRLREKSVHSRLRVDENGDEYSIYSFNELLPHHARFVQKCFRGWDHFYETRAHNGLEEYIQGFDRCAALPHNNTCHQLLEVYDELVDERINALIAHHIGKFGQPCCGSTTDMWSLKSCREAYGCFRASFLLDGDFLSTHVGNPKYEGTVVDMSPILSFAAFPENRHTGAALARWKASVMKEWKIERAIGLATEDGASNNKCANRRLKQEYKVCLPHDLARCVLHAAGLGSKQSKNPELKAFIAKVSKQSSSFCRSVVANKELQKAQLESNEGLHAHQVLTTKTMNQTRWLGLWEMTHRNRRISTEIRLALTGDASGICTEDAAEPTIPAVLRETDDSSDEGDHDNESESDSDGQNQDVCCQCLHYYVQGG